jgi:general secretion pathway protein N
MNPRTPRPTPPPVACGRGWFWALAFLGAAAGTLAFAPARWVTLAIEMATQQRIELPNAHGTVWRGGADVLLTGGAGSSTVQAVPKGMTWAIQPIWADGLAFQWKVMLPCCMPSPWQATLRPGIGQLNVDVNDHESRWPLSLMSGLGTPWNTVQLQGDLWVRPQQWSLHWTQGRTVMNGQLVLEASDLASQLSTLRPLGSYRMVLTGSDRSGPTFSLQTLGGALKLSGEGQWTAGKFRFRGLAEAPPERVDALSNLLNLLGRRDGLRAHLSLG